MTFLGFLKTKFATWILVPILLLAAVGFGRIYLQKRSIDNEIAKLQQRADKIQQDNEQLTELIKYLGTAQYQEKQAREKLNLKKEGEYVVSLPENPSTETSESGANSQISNIKEWFNYFFHANN